MPPIVYHTHGPDRTGGGSITRNLITDQTPETVLDVNAGAVWAFDVAEGLGVAPAAGESIWYFPGDLERQYMLSEWKFITSAAGRYMGMVARASTPGAGNLGYYLLGLKNNTDSVISSVTGAGTADHAISALPVALSENEIFRIQAWVITSYAAANSVITSEILTRAKVITNPGAAAYNLAGVDDPCFLAVKLDGGITQVITFASIDPLIAAFNAVTNAEVAAVINDQIVGGRAWVPAGTTTTIIATDTWGNGGSVDIDAMADDANGVLGFPIVAVTGAVTQCKVGNTARQHGFSGVIGGRGGNTAQWVRSFALTGA